MGTIGLTTAVLQAVHGYKEDHDKAACCAACAAGPSDRGADRLRVPSDRQRSAGVMRAHADQGTVFRVLSSVVYTIHQTDLFISLPYVGSTACMSA